jgi:plasmid stabilization system protein ParE
MRIIYHPEAEAELVETVQFYEGRVARLGAEFLIAVERAIQTIQDAPERWPIMEADVRRYLMPRFPFSIYYRVAGDELRILAFKHHSRHPDYWRERLSG